MDYSELPAPITFNTPTTPHRVTGLSAVDSTISEMVPLPSAPVQKNGLVPFVGNVALLVEIEKVNAKLDFAILELAKYNDIIKQGIADAEPVPAVAPVALDVTHTLAMHEMRVYIRNLAIAMALVVFVMSIVVMIAVYVIVYRLKEPAVCESFPSVLPTMYDNMMCCARMFSEDSS